MPYPYAPVTQLSSEYLAAGNAAGDTFNPNYSSIEGYVAAKTLVEGLKRAGNNPTTDSLIGGLESLRELSLGVFLVDFSAQKRTGSKFIDSTIRSALDPIVVSSNMPSGPFNRRIYAQCHGEHRAAHAVATIGRPNVATVTLDDGAADPQPEPGAVLLARDKGLEQFGQ